MSEYIGYIAGGITVLSFVPQVIRAYRTRSLEDLSIQMILLLLISGSLWIIYGIMNRDLPVIATNMGMVSLNGALLVAKAKYGGSRRDRAA